MIALDTDHVSALRMPAGPRRDRLVARLAERKVGLVLTDAAKKHVVAVGYDPAYGARPLKRVIQRLVQDPLALKILEGAFGEGAKIEADARLSGDGLEFRVTG